MATLQELIAQKETLEKQIALKQRQDREAAISKVRSLMAEYGLAVSDLTAKAAKGSRKAGGTKVAAKYRNKSTGESWSGRGLQPRWLKAALAAGRTLQDFSV